MKKQELGMNDFGRMRHDVNFDYWLPVLSWPKDSFNFQKVEAISSKAPPVSGISGRTGNEDDIDETHVMESKVENVLLHQEGHTVYLFLDRQRITQATMYGDVGLYVDCFCVTRNKEVAQRYFLAFHMDQEGYIKVRHVRFVLNTDITPDVADSEIMAGIMEVEDHEERPATMVGGRWAASGGSDTSEKRKDNEKVYNAMFSKDREVDV